MGKASLMAALVAALAVVSVPAARAYEFEVRAQSLGQAYQVRWLRFGEADRFLERRRFTQNLSVEIWDILAPAPDLLDPGRVGRAPFELRVVGSLRIDNDFGDYQTGEVRYADRGVVLEGGATDLVAELADGTLALDVPYAYVEGRGVGGWLDVRAGRQLRVDTLDWYAFDGVSVDAHAPLMTLSAHGGLLVRSASLWGPAARDPDGSSDDECRRVEVGGSGAWIASDDCAQRQALMPGFGVAAALTGVPALDARVAYRRAQSASGESWPAGAPGWGVNEELVSAEAGLRLGRGLVELGAAARYNLVLGEVDRADAGVRVGGAAWSLRGEASYTQPSFDADSIFAVFASEPQKDLVARGEWRPLGPALSVWAHGGGRWFFADEGTTRAWLAGAGASTSGALGRLRVELLDEDGEGGRRLMGGLSGRVAWRRVGGRRVLVDGRLSWARYDASAAGVAGAMGLVAAGERLATSSLGASAAATLELRPGVALQALVEGNQNRFDDWVRLLLRLDLAFVPEL